MMSKVLAILLLSTSAAYAVQGHICVNVLSTETAAQAAAGQYADCIVDGEGDGICLSPPS